MDKHGNKIIRKFSKEQIERIYFQKYKLYPYEEAVPNKNDTILLQSIINKMLNKYNEIYHTKSGMTLHNLSLIEKIYNTNIKKNKISNIEIINKCKQICDLCTDFIIIFIKQFKLSITKKIITDLIYDSKGVSKLLNYVEKSRLRFLNYRIHTLHDGISSVKNKYNMYISESESIRTINEMSFHLKNIHNLEQTRIYQLVKDDESKSKELIRYYINFEVDIDFRDIESYEHFLKIKNESNPISCYL